MPEMIVNPDGNGSYQQFSGVYGAGSHWQAISDDVADTWTYADGSGGYPGVTLVDTYTVPESLASGIIDAVAIYNRTTYYNYYRTNLAATLLIDGTLYYGTAYNTACYANWQDHSEIWSKNPDTLSDWTWEDASGLQIGAKAYMEYNAQMRCSKTWMGIYYTVEQKRAGGAMMSPFMVG